MSTWIERIELFFIPLRNIKSKEKSKSKSNWFKSVIENMQNARLEQAKLMLKNNQFYW